MFNILLIARLQLSWQWKSLKEQWWEIKMHSLIYKGWISIILNTLERIIFSAISKFLFSNTSTGYPVALALNVFTAEKPQNPIKKLRI